ncbi:MAG: hypothetical protein ABIF01_03605, partial [Candidatus Micrarchaeota archaeon]
YALSERIHCMAGNISQEFQAWVGEKVGFVDNVLEVIPPKITDAEKTSLWGETGRADNLVVVSSMTAHWYLEKRDFKGKIPNIRDATLVENAAPYQIRTTHLSDAIRMATGVLGNLLGYNMMHTAARDEQIKSFILSMADSEIVPTLKDMKGFDQPSLEHYMNSVIHIMSDSSLKDEISRVISNPLRKLGRDERLIAPAVSSMNDFGIEPRHMCFTIAAAMHYLADYNTGADWERTREPDVAYWERVAEKQELLRGTLSDIEAGNLLKAKKNVEYFLRENCGFDTGRFSERKLVSLITDYFIEIAKSEDFGKLLEKQNEEAKTPRTIRPSGVIVEG